MRLHLVLSLALIAGACGGDTLRKADGKLRVSTEPIEFRRTFVGFASEKQVHITNGSRVPREYRVSTEAPFSVSASGRVKERDGIATVTFTPEAPGRYQGILLFDLEGEQVEVPLRGTAEVAPPCEASGACRIVHFDEETGACTERVAADGTSCSDGNACRVDQTCRHGECLGKERNCDDGDKCTDDRCDPAEGCYTVDTSAECEQPSNPCEVAYCHAKSGCGIANAPDGTPCGAGDCVSASICRSGSCIVVDVPEGTPCTNACGKGACANKECKRPDGNVLKESWSRSMDPGTRLVFPGIGDASGNLYWIECGRFCELVSVEPKGHVRYRRRVAGGSVDRPEHLILADGKAVVLAGPSVSAFSTFDGEPLLSRELRVDLDRIAGSAPQDPDGGCPCTWHAGSLASDGEGALWAWFQGEGSDVLPHGGATNPPARPGVLVSLDPVSGEVRHGRAFADVRDASALVMDGAGNVFLTIVSTAGDAMRVSLSPGGDERWLLPAPTAAAPLASVGELVLESTPRAVHRENGFLSYDLPAFSAGAVPSVIASSTDGFLLGADPLGLRLVGFQPATGKVIQDARISHPGDPLDWTPPLLTSRRGALFAVTFSEEANPSGTGNRPETLVREIGSDGSQLRACELPGRSTYGGPAFLRSGSWTVLSRGGGGDLDTVHQFELPKADIAGSGWINVRGSLSGNGRSQ